MQISKAAPPAFSLYCQRECRGAPIAEAVL
jgi:hypothetical protein